MERERNGLYFRPDEKDKFYRAISLVERIVGMPQEENDDTIEHEKAHLRAIIDLGYEDHIEGFSIKVGERLRKYMVAAVIIDETEIPKEDLFKIIMAPENPSKSDYRLAACLNL